MSDISLGDSPRAAKQADQVQPVLSIPVNQWDDPHWVDNLPTGQKTFFKDSNEFATALTYTFMGFDSDMSHTLSREEIDNAKKKAVYGSETYAVAKVLSDHFDEIKAVTSNNVALELSKETQGFWSDKIAGDQDSGEITSKDVNSLITMARKEEFDKKVHDFEHERHKKGWLDVGLSLLAIAGAVYFKNPLVKIGLGLAGFDFSWHATDNLWSKEGDLRKEYDSRQKMFQSIVEGADAHGYDPDHVMSTNASGSTPESQAGSEPALELIASPLIDPNR